MIKTPISINEAVIIAKNIFGVSLPITLDELRTAYRVTAKRLHPDQNDSPDATTEFQHMQEAYVKLTKCSAAFSEKTMKMLDSRTLEGAKLSTLGMGLGPLVNVRDCPSCDHKGYTVTFERARATCNDCNGTGLPSTDTACRECKGTGKFTLKSNRIVDCRRCVGSGRVKAKPTNRNNGAYGGLYGGLYGEYASLFGFGCKSCQGAGWKYIADHEQPIYSTCKQCRGSGEERIFNPVIRRGALNGKRK